jgi:hypothetical protein
MEGDKPTVSLFYFLGDHMNHMGQVDTGANAEIVGANPEPVQQNSIVQAGTGENQIPVDLSKFKPGQQVKVTMTAKVSAGQAAPDATGAAPSMSLEILSANAEEDAVNPTAGMGEKEVSSQLDNALSNEDDQGVVAPV